MWYVMQTMTGQEEELVQLVQKMIPRHLYEDCFVAYYERVWRKQQQNVIHVERLFPGYVFITTEDPKELFLSLKQVPAMCKLIAGRKGEFLPIEKEEEAFFQDLLSGEHIVRLSYVESDARGRIQRVQGPLKHYTDQVVRYQFKKRYAIIRFQMLGAEKTIALGIILKEDVRQQIAYGKVEAPRSFPEFYQVDKGETEVSLSVGDHVKVMTGPLADMIGVVWKIKKTTVEIGTHLFGQDMAMEVPINDICQTSYKDDYGKK